MKTISMEVEGMSCAGCVSKITNHFNQNLDIKNINISLEDRTVVLSGEDDLSNMALRKEIMDLGFSVTSIKKI